MCYCPLPCLKVIVGIGALISILISLGLLALTIYANLQKQEVINHIGNSAINDYLIGLYLASTVFMLLGICGLYGAMKSKKKMKTSGKCLLGIYFIGVIVFFLAFVGASVFFFIGPEMIFGKSCESSSKTDLVDQLYKLNKQATQTFCSETCECYLNTTAEGAQYFIQILDDNNLYHTTNISRKNYQSCLSADISADPNILLMIALEDVLECNGWCDNQTVRFNRFTDMNKCLTKQCLDNKQACYPKFETFLKDQGKLLGYGCSVATLICFINMLTVCCICFHPSKQAKSRNFYEKMYDE